MRLHGFRALRLLAKLAQVHVLSVALWGVTSLVVLFAGGGHGVFPILAIALVGVLSAYSSGLWWELSDESLLRHDIARRGLIGPRCLLIFTAAAALITLGLSWSVSRSPLVGVQILLPAVLLQLLTAGSAWSVWTQCRYNLRRRAFFLDNWSEALLDVERLHGEVTPRLRTFVASQSGEVARVRSIVARHVDADADAARLDRLCQATMSMALKAYDLTGLRAAPFHDPADYHWIADLMAHFDEIQREIMGVLTGGAVLAPYPLIGLDAWKALDLYKGGVRVPEGCDACPLTAALVERLVPGGPVREVIISKLEPYGRLPPHIDNTLPMLTLHVPIWAPEPSGIRVGNELRAWRTGEPIIIDTTFEHEAWNDACEARINLMVDFWPDGLDAREKAFFTEVYRRQMRPHLKG